MEKVSIAFTQNSFFSNQPVTGNIEIHCRHPVKAGSIRFMVYGLSSTAMRAKEERQLFVRKNPKPETVEVRYSAQDKFLVDKVVVWYGDKDGIIPSGVSTYPFSFRLPANCPSTFKGGFGGTVYTMIVSCGNWEVFPKVQSTKEFRAIVPVEVPIEPISRGVVQPCKTTCKCEPITLIVTLPRSGYVPGEVIPITLQINNQSNGKIKSAVVSLYQMEKCSGINPGPKKSHKTLLKSCIAQEQQECRILQRTKNSFEMELKVPERLTPTSTIPHIVEVEYSLEVSLNTSIHNGEVAKVVIPILIGSVPLRPIVTRPARLEQVLGSLQISQFSAPPPYSSVSPSAPVEE